MTHDSILVQTRNIEKNGDRCRCLVTVTMEYTVVMSMLCLPLQSMFYLSTLIFILVENYVLRLIIVN